MTSATATAQLPSTFDEKALEEFLDSRDEPAWLTAQRRAAFAVFQEKSAAPLDPEEFKRVNLRTFRPEQFSLGTAAAATDHLGGMMQDRTDFAGRIVHVDGHCGDVSLESELEAKGVLFGNLADMVRDHAELIKPHLMTKAVQPETDRFSAWHAAFWTGGTFLYVPRNVEVNIPLYSLIALSNANCADLSHTLIILEDGAQATLLEETASADPDAPGLHVGAVELLIGKGARLRYTQLQNWNEKSYHLAHQCGRVAGDGFLQWTVGGLGSKVAHIHQDVHLDGRGAEAEVNGVTFSTHRQTLSYYTKQAHNAANTRSDLLYREVLRDRSRVAWRGMIRVEPDAQQTDGYQRSDALLMSDDARSDAIPGLEIEADDVRCTHAATAGRVDEEELFYCRSRGLSEYEAMHMIVEGFFHEVYDRIPVELVTNREDIEEQGAFEQEPIGLVRAVLSQAVEQKLGIGD
ncbi:Fe-S cluster assembly protein SufD [Thalassoroseus pseudoceratinae]|uniref:Fe-S cluster assembly protein SufD n=1 Tax=Thalassoroseus pseudoceratinae TaxID=2713176 RepID=UPI001423A386|nr:Fe-S cluster assembly protein SufD [Thalassoroseus pseudoceratinae]